MRGATDVAVHLISGASHAALRDAVFGFASTWTPADRRARGLPAQLPVPACVAAYMDAIIEPDHPRAAALLPTVRQDVQDAAAACNAAGYPALLGAPSAVWKVALLDPKPHAENGLPHTHADIVCLPTSMYEGGAPFGRPLAPTERVQILVHERVHVFQRANPVATHRLIAKYLGAAPMHVPPTLPAWVADRRRSNPDLDGRLWSTDGGRTTVVQLYDEPHGLGGLSASQPWRFDVSAALLILDDEDHHDDRGGVDHERLYEHPYEAMAYRIADIAVPVQPR